MKIKIPRWLFQRILSLKMKERQLIFGVIREGLEYVKLHRDSCTKPRQVHVAAIYIERTFLRNHHVLVVIHACSTFSRRKLMTLFLFFFIPYFARELSCQNTGAGGEHDLPRAPEWTRPSAWAVVKRILKRRQLTKSRWSWDEEPMYRNEARNGNVEWTCKDSSWNKAKGNILMDL